MAATPSTSPAAATTLRRAWITVRRSAVQQHEHRAHDAAATARRQERSRRRPDRPRCGAGELRASQAAVSDPSRSRRHRGESRRETVPAIAWCGWSQRLDCPCWPATQSARARGNDETSSTSVLGHPARLGNHACRLRRLGIVHEGDCEHRLQERRDRRELDPGSLHVRRFEHLPSTGMGQGAGRNRDARADARRREGQSRYPPLQALRRMGGRRPEPSTAPDRRRPAPVRRVRRGGRRRQAPLFDLPREGSVRAVPVRIYALPAADVVSRRFAGLPVLAALAGKSTAAIGHGDFIALTSGYRACRTQ